MEIETKFNVGDEVFFFRNYNKAKSRTVKDIVDGTVTVIKPWVSDTSRDISYYVATNDNEVSISESHLYGTYEEIEAKAVDKPKKKVDDSVREAYERLGRELGLI